MVAPPLTLTAWLRYDLLCRAFARVDAGSSVLEIGPGCGGLAVVLAEKYDYIGVEADRQSAAVAQQRLDTLGRGSIVHGELSALPANSLFDVVCAFEVLEHVVDDAAALRSWCERLRSGGSVIVSVPAFQRRYGPQDEWVGHYRRYERDALVALLRDAGIDDITLDTYGFPLGIALESFRNAMLRRRTRDQRSLEARTAASGRWLQPSGVGRWANWLVAAPFRVAQRPFFRTNLGMGFVATGVKGAQNP